MELRFDIVFDDLLDLQKDFVLNSKHHKKTKWAIFTLFTTLELFVLSLKSINFVSFGILILWTAFFIIMYSRVTLYSLTRLLKKQNLDLILGHNTMTFDDNGILRKTELTNIFFDWNQFVVIREDTKHYFLYISDTQGVILPKGAIANKEQEGEFKYYFDKYFMPRMNTR